jgi:hypothetical protein
MRQFRLFAGVIPNLDARRAASAACRVAHDAGAGAEKEILFAMDLCRCPTFQTA